MDEEGAPQTEGPRASSSSHCSREPPLTSKEDALFPPWGIARVSSRHPHDGDETRRDLFLPRAILWREGPESFFACASRFSGEASIDLGPLSDEVYDALEAYLLTDVVRDDHVVPLSYAADVFLLDRLGETLRRRTVTPRLCLNCRAWVVEDSEGACKYRPARRPSFAGMECVACDRAAKDCRCMRHATRHAIARPP